MKLAIATSQSNPKGVQDDQVFFKALTELGIQVDINLWDAAVDWGQYDLCLLRSVWDYHQRADEFSQWLQRTAHITPVINPAEIIEWNKNKLYLKELADNDLNIAPTSWLSPSKEFDLLSTLHQMGHEKYFLKPVIGADSSGTLRFDFNDAGVKSAQQHLNHWLNQVDMMIQPYIQTVETYGETSAVFFAGQFSHAIRKIPLKGDYRVQDTFGASDIKHELNHTEMNLAQACQNYLQNKFGTIMYARYDFLHDQNGRVYLNEAELIEPSLFFNHDTKAAARFANAIYHHMKTAL